MKSLQLMAKMLGQLKVDPEKVRQQEEILKKEFPKAKITVSDSGVKAEAVQDGDGVHCMVCGTPMDDRVNQYVKRGQWVQKKKKDNISNWECPKCRPLIGMAPLAWFNEDIFFPVKEEDLKEKAKNFSKATYQINPSCKEKV
jgi:hypothetical protein